MNSDDYTVIKETLQILIGKELVSFIRAGSMGDLGFGEYVEKEIRGFDEHKKIITKKVNVPKYTLHIDCHFRLSLGNTIILSRGDIFQPALYLENNDSFDYQSFNWDDYGKNRFDEIVNETLFKENSNFSVKKIVVSKLGDLKFHFENGFLLEIHPDISDHEECWRFFEQKNDNHLIVSGKGVETD